MNSLSPTAQAELFHRLLRLDQAATSPSLIAGQLHFSAMSIGRSFDDLVYAGHDLLRSPSRTEKFVQAPKIIEPLLGAGENALSELTDLAPPPLAKFAVAASGWKSIARNWGLVETDRDQAPASLKPGPMTPPACPKCAPSIHCRSTRGTGIIVTNASRCQRNNCWK